jgi:hypothetical protein
MAGNIVFGGIIGVGAGSGATKELKPNPLVLKLVPADACGGSDVSRDLWHGAGRDRGPRRSHADGHLSAILYSGSFFRTGFSFSVT